MKRKGNQSELNIKIAKLKKNRNLIKSVSGTPSAIGFSQNIWNKHNKKQDFEK